MPRSTARLTAFPFIALPMLIAIALAAATSFAQVPASFEHCRLFPGGVQEVNPVGLKVTGLKAVHLNCEDIKGLRRWAVIRSFLTKGEEYVTSVDTDTLRTELLRRSCLVCHEAKVDEEPKSRFASAIHRLNKAIERDVPLRAPSSVSRVPPPLVNAGLTKAEGSLAAGSFFTGDLCPGGKGLNRDVILRLESLDPAAPVPIALAISGRWLDRHSDDFAYLKERVQAGRLDITWVNHSNRHPFDPAADPGLSFLLTPGIRTDSEVLETERRLIENGVTPSVFFRFPGLVSDERWMSELMKFQLIPLGADAWLNKGQTASIGSIVLVHLNGNEPGGLTRFKKALELSEIPLPLQPILLAPMR